MRSRSGIGIDSAAPNIKPADTCFGIWSTVLAVNTLVLPSACVSTRPCTRLARLCAAGLPTYRPTASRPCSSMIARQPRLDQCERLVPLDLAPRRARAPRPVRTNGRRSRSGSASSCLIAVPFGQRKPCENTSSRSPRTSTISSRPVTVAPRDAARARRWPRRTGKCGTRPDAPSRQRRPAHRRSAVLMDSLTGRQIGCAPAAPREHRHVRPAATRSTAMEFGIFIQNPVFGFKREGNPDYEHQVIMRELELVQAADHAGFKYVWVTEHHFLDEYSHLSANDVICGYLAHATERIHIGSGIFNPLPQVNHPAKVAERVAMLDHLTEPPLRVRHRARRRQPRDPRVPRQGRRHRHHHHEGDLGGDDPRVRQDVAEGRVPGLRGQVVDAAAAQDPAQAVRQGSSRHVVRRRATRRATRWRPARASACSASRSGRSPSSSR